MDKGDLVAFVGKTGEWYETEFKGKKAYVSGKYVSELKIEKGNEAIEKVIECGTSLLGTKYVYGAVRYLSASGVRNRNFDVTEFDCSSLMQYIFNKGCNAVLQVNTRTQVKQGVTVAKDELRRGDLMFFTNATRYYNKGIERIGHVGLYLGNGYILHTASDHAVIEKITEKRQSYFITAKRIIGENGELLV